MVPRDGRREGGGITILLIQYIRQRRFREQRSGRVVPGEKTRAFLLRAVAQALLARHFLSHGRRDDFAQPLLDLAFAVAREIAADVVPEEAEVGEDGDDEREGGEDPDDEREQHCEQDDRVLLIRLGEDFDVREKLGAAGVTGVRGIGEEGSLHDGIQSDGIDGLTGALRNDNADGALELEVAEEGDVIGAFFAVGEFGEDEEAAPGAHALDGGGGGVEVVFCDGAAAEDADGADPVVGEEEPLEDDADGEDPAGDGEGDGGLDLAWPAVEGQEDDGGVGVCGDDEYCDDS